MSDLGLPSPELDPYFAIRRADRRHGPKKFATEPDDPREALAATSDRFRLAGNIGMVLAAFVFVLFAVPVSGMLTRYGEADGMLHDPVWLRARWEARMASLFGLSSFAAWACWGLSRLRPWSRRVLIGLSMVPGLCLVEAFTAGDQELRGDLLTLFTAGTLASAWLLRSVLSAYGRAVFSPDFRPDPKSSARRPRWIGGAIFAFAMLVAYWVALMFWLCTLAAFGFIRSP